MTNIEIRSEIEKSRFKKYQIAEQIGIQETSFSRMLRKELTAEQAAKVRKAIDELTRKEQADGKVSI